MRALKKLYQIVDVHWAEVCNSLSLIEELSEDPTFPAADLAAAVASKCFYHLQEYNDALRLALCAGRYLDISVKSEYVDTILAKCIDEYKALQTQQDGADGTGPKIDPRMENIIEQMFVRCYRDACFEQAVGVALDTRRIDKVGTCGAVWCGVARVVCGVHAPRCSRPPWDSPLPLSPSPRTAPQVEEVCTTAIAAGRSDILGYTFNLCQSARNIRPREFRLEVIADAVWRPAAAALSLTLLPPLSLSPASLPPSFILGHRRAGEAVRDAAAAGLLQRVLRAAGEEAVGGRCSAIMGYREAAPTVSARCFPPFLQSPTILTPPTNTTSCTNTVSEPARGGGADVGQPVQGHAGERAAGVPDRLRPPGAPSPIQAAIWVPI